MKKVFLSLLLILPLFLNSCKGQTDTHKITIVDIETIQQKALNKSVQLIDVRTPIEYKRGFIGSAINANIYTSDFSTVVKTLDKSKPIYIYCRANTFNFSCI